jgi:lysozyme
VWTIGYGHTSRAGPPDVEPGTAISAQQAREILAGDLDAFSAGVRSSIRTSLNDNQFSALVSFAYNVGLGSFRGSSVLSAVNSGDLEAVPRRLALWVKAGGKTLPGLIKRRAAEAALFLEPDETEGSQVASTGEPVEPILVRGFQRAHINIAALCSAVGGVASSAARHLQNVLGAQISLVLEMAAVAIVVAAALWILYERRKEAQQGI